MTDTYIQTRAFALLEGQTIRVRPAGLGEENFFRAEVRLVDSMNGYITVQFDGTEFPVALPAGDWRFDLLQVALPAPQVDGLFVAPDDAVDNRSASAVFRRQNGRWNDLLNPERGEIPEEEIPKVVALRAFAPTLPPTATATHPLDPARLDQERPVLDIPPADPAALLPEPGAEVPAEEPTAEITAPAPTRTTTTTTRK